MKYLLVILMILITGCSQTLAESEPDFLCPGCDPQPLESKEQIKEFMLWDKTNENEFVDWVYMCGDFANDVVRNARANGIEAHRMIIEYTELRPHAIVVFYTTEGSVYVDATQGDWWVEIVGDRYYSWSMTNDSVRSWYDIQVKGYFIE